MTDPPLSAPVLVVDDEPLIRQRILRLLAGLGYPSNALVCCATLAEARFHLDNGASFPLALIDLGLPDGSGLELIEILHKRDALAGILVVSACTTEDIILAALKLGATGYVLKERDDLEITMSLRSVLRGGAPIDPFVARRLLALLPPPASPAQAPAEAPLSRREQEILELVAQGHTNREIAEQLFVSPHTAACHIKNIYRKLAVTSRTRAIHEARSLGLL
ncbi:MAG: DNA-binding response regulator [Bordetella sp. SCN 67-23]|nr:response regulator transcription factor [Burkholderiales bacterium]ODS69039.1 MAG: DNA-binding response regulator [Bordetella sp. SCN 67-23]ODU76520.1 MAG: DNA-binding response regulator [Bordetella sp. SCN 68-11]OJW94463.1 MAG: DNA-binding response regulator [Burkholderiales bacterium 67-32]